MLEIMKYNKKYYLHQVIKNQGYRYNSKGKTVYVKFDVNISKQVEKLRDEFGYSIQTELC